MRSVWRLKIHIPDPRLSKGIAKLLHARSFYRPRRKIKQLHFAVKRGWIGKCPATNCLDVEGTAAEPAAIAAEAAQVGEFVEMLQTGIKRLESSHRQTRHGPVLASRCYPIVLFDHWDQIREHHLGEGSAQVKRRSRRWRGLRLRHCLGNHAARVVDRAILTRLYRVQVVHHDQHGFVLPAASRLSMI